MIARTLTITLSLSLVVSAISVASASAQENEHAAHRDSFLQRVDRGNGSSADDRGDQAAQIEEESAHDVHSDAGSRVSDRSDPRRVSTQADVAAQQSRSLAEAHTTQEVYRYVERSDAAKEVRQEAEELPNSPQSGGPLLASIGERSDAGLLRLRRAQAERSLSEARDAQLQAEANGVRCGWCEVRLSESGALIADMPPPRTYGTFYSYPLPGALALSQEFPRGGLLVKSDAKQQWMMYWLGGDEAKVYRGAVSALWSQNGYAVTTVAGQPAMMTEVLRADMRNVRRDADMAPLTANEVSSVRADGVLSLRTDPSSRVAQLSAAQAKDGDYLIRCRTTSGWREEVMPHELIGPIEDCRPLYIEGSAFDIDRFSRDEIDPRLQSRCALRTYWPRVSIDSLPTLGSGPVRVIELLSAYKRDGTSDGRVFDTVEVECRGEVCELWHPYFPCDADPFHLRLVFVLGVGR